jgi:hypothetical protein
MHILIMMFCSIIPLVLANQYCSCPRDDPVLPIKIAWGAENITGETIFFIHGLCRIDTVKTLKLRLQDVTGIPAWNIGLRCCVSLENVELRDGSTKSLIFSGNKL